MEQQATDEPVAAGPEGAGGDWYWCLAHQAVEEGPGCRSADRMGPYPSARAAQHWRESVERRNDAWDEEDERWNEGG